MTDVREKIEGGLRLYHACMCQDPRRTASAKEALEHRKRCLVKARDQIYAIPELLIKDDDQSLPEPLIPNCQKRIGYARGLHSGQNAMLKPDKNGSYWVKVKEK